MLAPHTFLFHLAVPCRDLGEAAAFYVERLGGREARRYADRVTLELFGMQLVCHLAPEDIDAEPRMYPRHFGFTLAKEADFAQLVAAFEQRKVPFHQPPFLRFKGLPEEHSSFFLCDPSNNLIEFKHYRDERMMF